MRTNAIIKKVTDDFAKTYRLFKDFQLNDKYQGFWDLCITSLASADLLKNIIFCNNVFAIPPLKTFLAVYKNEMIRLTGDERGELDLFVKKALGAFWGMTFKFALGYCKQKKCINIT